MTAQIVTEVEALVQEALAKAKSVGHTIADDLHHVLAKLRGEEATLQHEAEADGVQLAKDAEAAVAPVVAEAEHDAATLGSAAVADVQQAATDATQPPAAS